MRARGEAELAAFRLTPFSTKESELRIQVDNERHVDDLLDFLRKNGCIAFRADPRALTVHLPECNSDQANDSSSASTSTSGTTHPDAETTLAD